MMAMPGVIIAFSIAVAGTLSNAELAASSCPAASHLPKVMQYEAKALMLQLISE